MFDLDIWVTVTYLIPVIFLEDDKYELFFSLETKGKLMELNHRDDKLYVNYGQRLVTLLREVRQLTSLGFPVPAKIQHVATIGQKFYRHGVILKQVRFVCKKGYD